jgi:MFS transporter, NNP family, nitrate/nitrite transporter
MQHLAWVRKIDQQRASWASTISFTICFAVGTIFLIIGVQINKDFGLTIRYSGYVGTPVGLSGS